MNHIKQPPAQIVIFASGQGSNFRALHHHFGPLHPSAVVSLLVTDKPDCGAALFAKETSLQTVAVPLPENRDRSLHESKMIKALKAHTFQKTMSKEDTTFQSKTIIVLAGYMRIMSAVFLSQLGELWQNLEIINLHPANLDQYKGPKGYAAAVSGLFPSWGITVHKVTSKVDEGEVIGSCQILVYPYESALDVQLRNRATEHRLLVQSVQYLSLDSLQSTQNFHSKPATLREEIK